MPGRNYTSASGYRYGFNGQEIDDEIKGAGNSINYKFRMYDPRISRFLAVDPIASEYPMLTPYQHSSLNPIWNDEIEGLEGRRFQDKYERQANMPMFRLLKDVWKKIKSAIMPFKKVSDMLDEPVYEPQSPDYINSGAVGTKDLVPNGASTLDGLQAPDIGNTKPDVNLIDNFLGDGKPLDNFKHGDTVIAEETTPNKDPKKRTLVKVVDTADSGGSKFVRKADLKDKFTFPKTTGK